MAKKQRATKNISSIIPEEPQIRKTFHLKDLKRLSALTDNQEAAFEEWDKGQNIVLSGYAGVGKTLIALYLALKTVLDPDEPQKHIVIAKTPVQGFSIGYLPGELEEKLEPFEVPYKMLLDKLFQWKKSYDNLKTLGTIQFEPLVAVRGKTFDDSIIIVDEFQNMKEREIESIISRSGKHTRIIFCGDHCQNEIGKDSGFSQVLPIFRRMKSMSFIEFALEDIVRGGLSREFLIAKYSDDLN